MRFTARWITLIAVTALVAGGVVAYVSTSHSSAVAFQRIDSGATVKHARPTPTASPTPVYTIQVTGAPSGVHAKGAVLADAATGQVLWSRDLETERPMASITKVMTALLVLQSGDLNRVLTVPSGVLNYVWKYDGDSAGFKPGEKLTEYDLLEALLVTSAADAAYTFATDLGPGLSAWVAKMNAEAVALGMDHALHLARRAAVPDRDLHLFHARRPADTRAGRDEVPAVPLDRGSAVVPSPGRVRASGVLVGQHG